MTDAELGNFRTEARTWLERCLEAFPDALPRQRAPRTFWQFS